MNLRPFCGVGILNMFGGPWTDGEWTYAASPICAIRVRKEPGYAERHERKLTELFKIYPSSDEWVTWPEPEFHFVPNQCWACMNGLDVGGGFFGKCPFCGDVGHDICAECYVAGTPMNAWMAHLISKLPDVELFTGKIPRGNAPVPPTAFRFHDGQGLLMPIKVRPSVPNTYAERLLAATPGTIFITADGKEVTEIPEND